MRSDALLLPGENAAEFQEVRLDLFRRYHPCTLEEARCVEDMALHEWRKARCRRWEAFLDKRLEALHGGHPDAPPQCESDPHRWMHHSMDCELKEGRLDRQLIRAQARLLTLQKQRRKNLIAGAIDGVADWQELERRGTPQPGLPAPGSDAPDDPAAATVAQVAVQAPAPTEAVAAQPFVPPAAAQQSTATVRAERRNQKNSERIPTGWDGQPPAPAARVGQQRGS